MAATPDADMFTRPFQLTRGMHRNVYAAVDPTNPDLSAAGKVVLVTGASGGLGYAIAKAWSLAGADGIALVGRSEQKLESTASDLQVPTLVTTGDLRKVADVRAVFAKAVERFGRIDVVVHAAGTYNVNAKIGDIDPDQWWVDYETNVKAYYNLVHHLVKTNGGKGTVINLVSLGAAFLAPGMTSYAPSKLAALKLAELIDLELTSLRVFSVHPGIVEAENGRGSVMESFMPFAKDKAALTGGITLYLQKSEADHLRGGYISVNWDVEEMQQHEEEIREGKLLKLQFLAAKLGPEGHPWNK